MRGRKAAVKPFEKMTVAYLRVSTTDQAENGVSLDAQEARIAAYATAMGFDISEVIRDAGESAKSLRRPRNGERFSDPGMTRRVQRPAKKGLESECFGSCRGVDTRAMSSAATSNE